MTKAQDDALVAAEDLMAKEAGLPSLEAMREACAKIVEGRVFAEHYREWPPSEGNRAKDSEIVRHCDRLAAQIRALSPQIASAGGGEKTTPASAALADEIEQQIPDNRDWITVGFHVSQRPEVVAVLRAAGVAQVAPEKGWLKPALDRAEQRAAEMPDWMRRTAYDDGQITAKETECNQLRAALREARSTLASLDHMNGEDSGLDVIRGGKPIKNIIDDALSVSSANRGTTIRGDGSLCSDCPPLGDEYDGTRCVPCPRRRLALPISSTDGK